MDCLPLSGSDDDGKSLMDSLLGLLRVRVKRGINLAVRDVMSSDPYVVVKMGKTDKVCNVMTVYDHDTFTKDDKMGDAEFNIKAFIEALKMDLEALPNDTVISKVQPCRSNCFAEESCVIWKDHKVIQDMCLRLRNVECGEVEIQLQWIDLPGSLPEWRALLLDFREEIHADLLLEVMTTQQVGSGFELPSTKYISFTAGAIGFHLSADEISRLMDVDDIH
nr:protein C2-DOMAIN ABA-RELATED 4 [Ipomoea batatas]